MAGISQNEHQDYQRRVRLAKVGILLVIAVLGFRLWQLQIHEGSRYRELSEDNRTRAVVREPARGLIYDRNGVLLANNVPSFTLYVTSEDVDDREALVKELANLIGFDEDLVSRKLSARGGRFVPKKIKDRLTLREAALIESNRLSLPGVMIQAESQRNYPAGTTGAHLVGYVGEVSALQLDQPAFEELHLGSIVGQYGVESTFDRFLRGQAGERIVEVDAHGHEKRTVKVHKPQAGDDLYLTIDIRLQRLAEELLGEEFGAIVAMDPTNGEVLALASRPAFDPNVLSRELTPPQWEEIVNDEGHPLTNRATQGQYPPGSTLKIVMGAAALETKTVEPDTEVRCAGGFQFGRRVYRDWKPGGHGKVKFHGAIVDSCDVYFYTIGQRMGIETMAAYMRVFGLGRKTGIELPSERIGIVPTPSWKERVKQEIWLPGETISASIGQGYVTVTPIQMAQVTAAFANRGVVYRPHLVRAIMERTSGRVQELPVVPRGRLNIHSETIDRVRAAMEAVVTDGTAKRAKSPLVTIAGKTGTAQTASIRIDTEDEETPKRLKDHAWFVSYAPVEEARIAVAVLVEHMGHGGSAAAPLARRLIETYVRLPPVERDSREPNAVGRPPVDPPGKNEHA